MKFADDSVPRRFTAAGRPGVYLRVLQTGSVTAGDTVEQLTSSDGISVRELFLAYTRPQARGSSSILTRALDNPFLDPDMLTGINKRLQALQDRGQ